VMNRIENCRAGNKKEIHNKKRDLAFDGRCCVGIGRVCFHSFPCSDYDGDFSSSLHFPLCILSA